MEVKEIEVTPSDKWLIVGTVITLAVMVFLVVIALSKDRQNMQKRYIQQTEAVP